MNADMAMDICRRALEVGVLILAPILLSALCAGVLAGLFQAATQIQEPTLAFVPKIIALAVALLYFGPWLSDRMRTFTIEIFTQMGQLSR